MNDRASERFRTMGAAFATGGAQYDRLRPGYPDEAVDWVVAGTPRNGRVVDVGAGSGKLTIALAARGLKVTAVDPSADMLSQLSRRLPTADVQLATGEHTGLADHDADLATFAQSWHWVDPTDGAAEMTRILAPGGAIAMVWNFTDVRVPWVAELADTWHTLASEEAIDATRHRPALGPSFSDIDTLTVDWTDSMSLADLAELVTTRSYYLTSSPEDQREIRRRVDELLAQRFPSDATVGLPYRTHCYRARCLS